MKKLLILAFVLLMAVNGMAQEKHPIEGSWVAQSVTVKGETRPANGMILTFDKGNVLKISRTLDGESAVAGKWKCDKKKKMLVLKSSNYKEFNGKAQVLKLDKDEFSYKKDGMILTFKRPLPKKASGGESVLLKYKTEDFITENGDEKYFDDWDKIPWTIDQIFKTMKNVKEMVYNVDHYEPGHGKTGTRTVRFKVNFVSDHELSIREYSDSKKDFVNENDEPYVLNEQTAGDMVFFPQAEPQYFRFTGTESITTPAGTFECLVMEGVGEFDLKLKYWMIKNKPGVFAKIIKSKEDGFSMDYTDVYTLTEIK